MKILNPSATNRIIYIMIITLAGMSIYSLIYYPVLVFPTLLSAFLTILGQFSGFKSGRSMPEQNSVSTTVNRDESKTEINKSQDTQQG